MKKKKPGPAITMYHFCAARDVRAIMAKPGKNWETFLWECGKLLIAAVIGAAIAYVGLK